MKQSLPEKQKIFWPDNMEYFLTTSTFLHYPYFREYQQKQIVLKKIKELKRVLGVPILAYSIAINHLHLKFFLRLGRTMTQLKNMLHSGISREYKKIYAVPYEQFWGSTRVYYIKDQKMSLYVSGYTNGNLLKHREVSTFRELEENPFSSYWHFKKIHGDEEARQLVYSVIDINEDAEGGVDFRKLNKIYTPPFIPPHISSPSIPHPTFPPGAGPPLAEVEG